jgi:hypothetical protein
VMPTVAMSPSSRSHSCDLRYLSSVGMFMVFLRLLDNDKSNTDWWGLGERAKDIEKMKERRLELGYYFDF